MKIMILSRKSKVTTFLLSFASFCFMLLVYKTANWTLVKTYADTENRDTSVVYSILSNKAQNDTENRDARIAYSNRTKKAHIDTENRDASITYSNPSITNKKVRNETASITSHSPPVAPGIHMGNKDICSNLPNLKYFIYIHSGVTNMERRLNVRKTWGNLTLYEQNRAKLVFVMGKPTDDHVQRKLEVEYKQYSDILQGDFMDTYRNLTLKGIFALWFTANHCSNAQYVIKTDDDTFLNIYKVVRFPKKEYGARFMICPLKYNSPILRNPGAKWYVEPEEFPGQKVYPPYCQGQFYMTNLETIKLMYMESKSTPFFWIDDVYITGVLIKKIRQNVNVKFVQVWQYFTVNPYAVSEMYSNRTMNITIHIAEVTISSIFLSAWKNLTQRLQAQDQQKLIL